MTRPRVALLAHSVDDAGATGFGMERALAELLRHAHDRVDFVVLSSDLPADLAGLVEWRRVPLPRRPSLLRLLVFFVVAGARLRGAGASVVQATGAIVPNRVSLAVVHYCHTGSESRVGAGAPLLRRANSRLYRQVAALCERRAYRPARVRRLVAVSAGLAGELRRHFPGVPVDVVPNGVDIERFRPDAVLRVEVRAEAGAGEDDVVALFVGGDWERKGLELAIAAAGRAGIALWVVGDGDERRYRALAGGNGVRFFGRRTDPERYYAGADLFVLPSVYETFSLVAHEAAAAGLPVVATDVSGVGELVLQGGGGILVERDPEAIAAALQALAADPERRRLLGAKARAWAGRFTWSETANALVRLYDELAEGHAG